MAKYHEYIRNAVDLGYSFDFENNLLITPKGSAVQPKLYGKQRYPSTTINLGGKNVSFTLHKFVAFLLYREDAFKEGFQVRHLDGNTLNLSDTNIVLGTSSENQYDKKEEVRKSAARKARASQGKRPLGTKVTEEQAYDIIKVYLQLKGSGNRAPRGSIKSLCEKYNLGKSCVSSICCGRNFKDIYIEVKESFNV